MATSVCDVSTDDILPPKMAEYLASLRDDPRVTQASQLCRHLEAEKRRVGEALRSCSTEGPAGPAVRHDASADAAALLSGTPVTTLDAPAEENQRFGLLRQLRALERAVPAAEDRRRETCGQVSLEAASRLRPHLQRSYGQVADALAGLLFELQRHHDFVTRLHQAGIEHTHLHVFELSDMEVGLMNQLGTHIRNRRQGVGLEIEERE